MALPGAMVYLALLLSAMAKNRPAMTAMATMAGGAALWFLVLQGVVIRRFCVYCVLLHSVGLLIAGLIGWGLASAQHGNTRVQWPILPLLSGISAVGLLMGGQILLQRKTFAVTLAPQASPGEPPPSPAQAPVVSAPSVSLATVIVPPALNRAVSLFRGKILLEMDDWPIFGDPRAAHVLADLYDYTCPDCRHVHGLLMQAVGRYPSQLSILAIPVPLERRCNHHVTYDAPHHQHACEYARLALAVWLARPAAFADFDRWLFTPQQPASVEQARQEAGRLAGEGELAAALANPRLAQRHAQSLQVFVQAGAQQLPRVVLPDAVLWGRVPGAGELFQVLEAQLKLTTMPARSALHPA